MPAGPFIRISGHVAAKQIAMEAAKGITLVWFLDFLFPRCSDPKLTMSIILQALLAGFSFKLAVMDRERDDIARHYEMLKVKEAQK